MRLFKHGGSSALLMLGAALLVLSGCFKDDFDFDRMREDMVSWEPDIAFPVVYSTITADEIISQADSTNIYEFAPDNFITLIYRKRIFSQTINSFFQLPSNQEINQNISLTPTETISFTTNGTVQKTVNSGMTLAISGPGGSQLDKVVYQSGSMNISFTSSFQHSGTLQVSMPELRLNGVAYVQSFPIAYSNGPVSFSISIPLAGYEMDLNNGTGQNAIPIDYTLTLNQGGGSIPIPTDQVQITHSFNNLVMAFADGDFGTFDLAIDPAQVDLDVAQSEHGGYLYFEDPRLRLQITNSIGAIIGITLDEFYATGPLGQIDVDLSSQITNGQFTIPAAPSIGSSSFTEYYFNKDNSNIKPIINDQYELLHHDLSALVNPNGPAYNFAQLNSAVEVVAEIELPFWGLSNHFTIIDTLSVEFTSVDHLADNIDKAMLRISTTSHFPVDGILKLYFADSAYNVIDSVLTDGSFIIRSGVVNGDGKVTSSTITNNDINLDTARINNLFRSDYLLLSTDLTTTDNAGRNIKLYREDNIEVRIGLRVKLHAKPSDINEF